MRYKWTQARKFNGRQYERGDTITRDEILAVNPEKLGTLERVRLIEPDPLTNPVDKMTKDELIQHARDIGAKVDHNWRKAQIREAVEDALHG